MENRNETNKRLVKNTFALYCRTAIVMVVSLVVTRYLLKVLGEEDYGLYNVVASVVVLFTFLNASMTQAIQRFITYELGKEDHEGVKTVFSMSFITQMLMIIVLILLCEGIGVWFINCKLKIDPERLVAANWAFQLSILTFCVNFLRVPYESTVIAYERMAFFAYASIIDAVLKLILVFLLALSPIDKLVTYAFLLAGESFLMYLVYRFYCRKKFETSHFHFVWDKAVFFNLLSFSGWSVCASATNIATQKGFVFLLNYYVSLVANAAMGIATQVSTAVNSFVAGFQTSFRPQIVKAYAQDDKPYLVSLITKTSKLSFVLVFIPAIIIIVNAPLILRIWLTDVPDYTISFCRLILVCCIIDGLTGPYNCAIIATGSIRNYQIAISISFTIDLALCWFFLKNGMSAHYILYFRILTRGVLNMIIGLYYLQKQIGFDVLLYAKKVLLPIVIYLVLFLPVLLLLHSYFSDWTLLITSTGYITIFGLILSLLILFTQGERAYLRSLIHKNAAK